MSFRDGQRRYGHVPPVQYPVAGQQHQQGQQQDEGGVGRRPSFNSGDDTAYYNHPQGRGDAGYGNGADELFLSNPAARQPNYGSTAHALSGYQHQYQDPTPPTPSQSTYNPQSFAHQPQSGFQRTQSTTLPYRQPQQSPQYPPQHRTSFAPSPTNYTPQAYNPAAYASATSPQRQPTYHGYSSPDPSYGASAAGSHGSPSYGHSPGSTSSASFQQSSHAQAYHGGYSQPAQSSSIPGFSPQTPTATYDPAQFVGAQFANGSGAGQQQYSQAPYPTTSQMPVGPYGNDRNSIYNRDSRSNSQTSPLTSPPLQPQPSPGLQRHPTNAPLPRRPEEQDGRYDNGHDHYSQDQARLMQDIEAELGAIGPRDSQRMTNGQYANRYETEQDSMRRYNSSATTLAHTASAASRPSGVSSFEEDDDDPEGTAGVLAMQQAEMDDRRFSGATFTSYDPPPTRSDPLPPPPEEQDRSSSGGSDFGGTVDLGMLSGGYAGNLTYGNDVGSPPSRQDSTRPLPSPNYFNAQYEKHESAPNYHDAHMDYGGTGGLQPPSAARLSFDEGDERVSLHSRQSDQESPPKNEYEDLFYHPGLTNRPLPTVPPGTGSDSSSMLSVNTNRGQLQHTYSNSTDSRHYQHENPETFYGNQSPAGLHPERSISLGGHSNTPQVYAPARSRTDAAEERKKANRQQQVVPQGGPISEYDSTSGTVGAFDGITLPSGRKRRFIPSKLSTGDFRRCVEPWALSGVERWIRDMADGEVDLKEKTIEEALILLFTFKVPTMNVADAEVLASRVVSQMLESGTIIPDEEWVKFGDGHISGVFWQLAGAGCYAPRVHVEEISGRCYSYHCTRTVKKVDLDDLDPESNKSIEWHVFYGLRKEDLEGKDGKEIKRQNNLHEIVTGEEKYIKQLDFFRTVYRDDLRSRNPPLLNLIGKISS